MAQNAPKTAAQRKADERARQKQAGRESMVIYVHPNDRAAVRAFVELLQRERDKAKPAE